jgi:hypothetical protein
MIEITKEEAYDLINDLNGSNESHYSNVDYDLDNNLYYHNITQIYYMQTQDNYIINLEICEFEHRSQFEITFPKSYISKKIANIIFRELQKEYWSTINGYIDISTLESIIRLINTVDKNIIYSLAMNDNKTIRDIVFQLFKENKIGSN